MSASTRLLILGATGQLGTALATRAPESVRIGSRELDLTSSGLSLELRDLISSVRPSAVVNCAAFTAVDRAEAEEPLATAVNGGAVGILAEVAAECDVPIVTFSTDYVFDGSKGEPYVESDSPSPLNAYGRSKVTGELAALAQGGQVLVIRTSWVISSTHPNFVATMLRLVGSGESVSVVGDQFGSPTVATDLALGTLQALEQGVTGILHLSNFGQTTWFDLARAATSLAGLDASLVQPCSTAEYPTLAARPRYSVLGTERTDELQFEMPPWERSLATVVARITSH